jgi:uncharacterized protein YdhG (YjbR/CyaY superfamily)
MITKAKDIDDFLNKIDPSRKADMSKLRKIIKKTLPKAKETLMYGMPTYEINDVGIVAFNSQKNYMSFYVASEAVKKNKDLLKGLNCGKCCIRFTSLDKLPEATIVKILKDSVSIC